ncbi:MAG: hypothetical protein GEU78_19205, partial [Actinobacteria bacterium]|nr:hypothetical protein [Actinomycetota bacterium]
NATKAAEGHDDYRKHSYALRSFLHCGICGLRMHGNVRRGRDGAYYTCELNRRQASLVPGEHPRTVYLREDRAGEKVVEFLSTHVFGPERVDVLREALATTAPEADKAQAEVERLRGELASLQTRIKRLVTNLEAEEPGSEVAADIRARMDELARLRSKKQAQLEAAEKEATQVPDPASAEALMSALPLLDVDWELVSDQEFRDLLTSLNFEASYDPTKRELTIRVTLVPELTDPDGPRAPLLRAPLLFVPPGEAERKMACRRTPSAQA